MSEQVYEALTDVFREVFADDDITLQPETSAKDIDGWDSFTHLNLIVMVEARFGIKIQTDEIENLQNVGDLVAIIDARM
jgi:acyl carrier protein